MADEIVEETIARMKGKKLPPVCPHCGKRLHEIYSSETNIMWSEKMDGYVHSPYFGEGPHLCCVGCNIRLDDDLAREILESL